MGYMGGGHDGYMPAGLQQQQPPQQTPYRQQPTGARLKVMRCVQLKAPESKRALLDFGMGVGVDLDRQVRRVCVCVQRAVHSVPACACRRCGSCARHASSQCGAQFHQAAVWSFKTAHFPDSSAPGAMCVVVSPCVCACLTTRSCTVLRASRLLTC